MCLRHVVTAFSCCCRQQVQDMKTEIENLEASYRKQVRSCLILSTRGSDYKDNTNSTQNFFFKLTVLNNTKLRHFWAQIVSWAPRHARKTFIVLAPALIWCRLRAQYSLVLGFQLFTNYSLFIVYSYTVEYSLLVLVISISIYEYALLSEYLICIVCGYYQFLDCSDCSNISKSHTAGRHRILNTPGSMLGVLSELLTWVLLAIVSNYSQSLITVWFVCMFQMVVCKNERPMLS